MVQNIGAIPETKMIKVYVMKIVSFLAYISIDLFLI